MGYLNTLNAMLKINEYDSDESLMERVKAGDHEAFSVLVMRHTSRFYVDAYRICKNEQDSEDVVQDAFLKIWRNPYVWKSDKGATFTTWFYRIVTNQAIDHYRKQKNTKGDEGLERIKDESASQEQLLSMSDEQKALEKAIAALPDRQRQALNLCFYSDFSNKEAAREMGVGLKALESLLMRAKKGIKEHLARQERCEDEAEKEHRYG